MADTSPSETKAFEICVLEADNHTNLPPDKAGTVHDRLDMARLGRAQEFRRNFSFIPIFGFAAVLMMTWASALSTVSYVLPNGGIPAMIYIYIITLIGFGAAIVHG